MIKFFKFQGTGNDFVVIDNRTHQFKGDKVKFAQKWCDRRFGIGSDGAIFIENSDRADFQMDFYNPDGSQSFCGNGSRCAVLFAKMLGIVNGATDFEAIDGIHEAEIEDNNVKIKMNDVGEIERIDEDYFLDTGSPHYISYCDDKDDRDIVEFGREIRYSERFKTKGTNVNLIKEISIDQIDLRTYERGVENETFACGTGATAAGLVQASKNQAAHGIIDVKVKGGDLKIHYQKKGTGFENVWLEGPAKFVFKGEINE